MVYYLLVARHLVRDVQNRQSQTGNDGLDHSIRLQSPADPLVPRPRETTF